ncbi:NADH dehydrogenase [Natronospira proteinivora]|uniref:NADH dehydrogenase n=1 Tax=Natronospira proteinivora TaxID=1807133 RepID=A0ABT1GAF6_9GAMM|nr:complex I NDUFA9 subunit family protein [Natronospira proteinivora]MCP1728308.1 NADH dehydrogenase [Natronospira proteinivora]
MNYRSICLLGGTGFVGEHLAARLAQEGVYVKILTRYAHGNKRLKVLPTVELVEANCHDPAVLEREFRGMDAVINLVGILNEKGRKGEGFRHAHVELTRKVLDACETAGVNRLLHMSALGADASGPSHYLRSKGEAEGLIHVHSNKRLKSTIFQPSTIFGPNDSFVNRFAGLLKLLPVFPLACPNSRMQPIYVGDVVEAFLRCLDDRSSHGRRYQLAGPDIMTLKEIVSYIAKAMGKRRLIIGLPDVLARLQANVMEFVPGKPFSRDNYNSLQVDNVASDNDLETLGIDPTSMDAVVPGYLSNSGLRGRFPEMRQHAKR